MKLGRNIAAPVVLGVGLAALAGCSNLSEKDQKINDIDRAVRAAYARTDCQPPYVNTANKLTSQCGEDLTFTISTETDPDRGGVIFKEDLRYTGSRPNIRLATHIDTRGEVSRIIGLAGKNSSARTECRQPTENQTFHCRTHYIPPGNPDCLVTGRYVPGSDHLPGALRHQVRSRYNAFRAR